MNRRKFLKMLGIGAGATAVGVRGVKTLSPVAGTKMVISSQKDPIYGGYYNYDQESDTINVEVSREVFQTLKSDDEARGVFVDALYKRTGKF